MGTLYNCKRCGDPVDVREVVCSTCTLEGSWLGPDKVAHFLFVLAVVGWARVFWPDWALVAWIGSIIVAGLWELSNRWWVFKGKPGISILDFLGFLVGGIVAGLLLWWA